MQQGSSTSVGGAALSITSVHNALAVDEMAAAPGDVFFVADITLADSGASTALSLNPVLFAVTTDQSLVYTFANVPVSNECSSDVSVASGGCAECASDANIDGSACAQFLYDYNRTCGLAWPNCGDMDTCECEPLEDTAACQSLWNSEMSCIVQQCTSSCT
jgi:hypothetical protein